MTKWYVSRQSYWGVDDPLVVEIAYGGLDYANPDMLSDPDRIYRYLGCDQEYSNPFEAIRAAFKIRKRWESFWKEEMHYACPRIEIGGTGGNTLPFEEYPLNADLCRWARMEFDKLERCQRCGEPLGDEHWTLWGDESFGKFCSRFCAEEYEFENFYEENDEED